MGLFWKLELSRLSSTSDILQDYNTMTMILRCWTRGGCRSKMWVAATSVRAETAQRSAWVLLRLSTLDTPASRPLPFYSILNTVTNSRAALSKSPTSKLSTTSMSKIKISLAEIGRRQTMARLPHTCSRYVRSSFIVSMRIISCSVGEVLRTVHSYTRFFLDRHPLNDGV